jgi:REP element-mobilizing transposase RayT
MRQRKQIRLRDYDYSGAGGYFITICTCNRENLLGKILEQSIELNEFGKVAIQWWLELENRFPEIKLDYHVIMPNHIHGIIIMSHGENDVGAIHELPLPRGRVERRRMVIPKVIGYFKMNSAKHINLLRNATGDPLWQRNYYEHIVRNEVELSRVREYIQNNPLKWDMDRENPLSKNFNMEHKKYWQEIYEKRRGNS